jgi:hypothetical protein
MLIVLTPLAPPSTSVLSGSKKFDPPNGTPGSLLLVGLTITTPPENGRR